MASTFWTLDIAKSALNTYQTSITTTFHNISNAETEGYSRQEVVQTASDAFRTNNQSGMIGAGVKIVGIEQQRNNYYDVRYRANNTTLNEYSIKKDYMKQIEDCFNEINFTGTNTQLSNFFNSLVSLQTDTIDSTKREQVLSDAKSLAEYFNSLSKELSSIQEDVNFEIKNVSNQINTIAQQIVSYNSQINAIETGSNSVANDLRDKRNLLIDELSSIANVEVEEKNLGNGVTSYSVTLGGYPLVKDNTYHTLVSVSNEKSNQSDISGLYTLRWDSEDGAEFELLETDSGKLKGLFDLRDGNNGDNFTGSVKVGNKGSNTVILENTSYSLPEDAMRLSIPAKGTIKINNVNYEYSSFEVNTNEEGKLEYTFNLDNPLQSDLVSEATGNGAEASIASSIDFKGIPYYQQQINQFVRTFSQAVNNLTTQGVDANGEAGLDFFSGKDKTDSTGTLVGVGTEGFSSIADNTYYSITAETFSVNKKVESDIDKIVTQVGKTDVNGVQQTDILDKIIELQSDATMFKQGKPTQFLQSIVGDVSVDVNKIENFYDNQEDVVINIENQKYSVSGVDTNEEGVNLIRFQNGYNLACKIISTLSEMYDKLINEMGV